MGTRQASYYGKYQGKRLLCTSYYPASSSFNRAVYKKKKNHKAKQANPPKHTQSHSSAWLIKFKVQDYKVPITCVRHLLIPK